MLEVVKEMVNLRILQQTPFLLIALRYFILIEGLYYGKRDRSLFTPFLLIASRF
jgi:hypothetical protein